jgi:hypothetical protein
MKKWKCPHCAKTSETEDNIMMVICPICIDCSMYEYAELKNFDEGWNNQLCLRCFKANALRDGTDEGDYYCAECVNARKHFVKKLNKETENLWEMDRYNEDPEE